jgi:DNA-binding NarL/FixJ family response regulator
MDGLQRGHIGDLNGIEASRQTAKPPSTAVVMLSMHPEESYLLRALKAGARGYLLKDAPDTDLINAIRAAAEGKAYFSPAFSHRSRTDPVRSSQRHDLLKDFTPTRNAAVMRQ